jgi:predicted ATPase
LGIVKLAQPISEVSMPPTMQGILAARVDALPGVQKEFLQTLAVLGKEFTLTLVKKVASRPDDEIERILRDLQLRKFIYEQPSQFDVEYIFKHALTQEVAYNSVLQERRRMLHERIGYALEKLYPNQLQDHLSELSWHYSHSGNVEKAVQYLFAAGRESRNRRAFPQAISHLKDALERCRELPKSSDRSKRLEAEILPELGRTYTTIGDSRLGNDTLFACAKLARELNDPELFANAARWTYISFDLIFLAGLSSLRCSKKRSIG